MLSAPESSPLCPLTPSGEEPVGLEANLKPINTGLCFFLCPCVAAGREREREKEHLFGDYHTDCKSMLATPPTIPLDAKCHLIEFK